MVLEEIELIVLGIIPNQMKNGIRITEYWNKFQRNQRCPRASNLPKIGIQKNKLLQIIPIRNPSVKPARVISCSPKITEPAKPIVQAPKNIGISKRLHLSVRNTFQVLRLKAKAVPIPEIINKAASLH